MKKTFYLLLLALSFCLQQTASAQDWQLRDEKADPYLGVPSCRALTNKSSFTDPIQLSLSFPKDRLRAPVAVLTVKNQQVRRIEIHFSSGIQAESALPLEGSSYWYIPLKMDQLVEEVGKAYALEVVLETDKGAIPVQISLTGSAFTLLMIKKCLHDEELYDREFFRELGSDSVEPKEVNGDVSVLRLQDLFQMAYSFFKTGKELESTLTTLREENKEALLKEASVQKNWAQLSGEITTAENSIKDWRERSARSQSGLKSLNEEKTRLALAQEAARETLRREKESFQPLEARYLQFEQEVASAKQKEEKLTAQIASAQSKTVQLQQENSRLEQEKSALGSRIAQAEKENETHKARRLSLRGRLDALNVQKEVSSRMSREAVFQQAQAKIQDLMKTLKERQIQAHATKTSQQNAQIHFERCRRNHLDQEVLSCPQEMAQLQKAQGENHVQQSLLRETNSMISFEQDKIEVLRKSISLTVLQERDALQHEWDDVNAKVNVLESWLKQSKARVRDIETREIPENKKQMSQAAEEIAQCRHQMTESQMRRSGLEMNFEAFKQQSLYSQRQERFLQVQNDFQKAQKELQDKEAQIQQAHAVMGGALSEIPKIQSRLSFLQSQIPQARQERQQMAEELKDVHRREALLEKQKEDNDAQYALSLRHYRYGLLKVLNH